jgi:hypothetical protein
MKTLAKQIERDANAASRCLKGAATKNEKPGRD